jgi:hypothetical protein
VLRVPISRDSPDLKDRSAHRDLNQRDDRRGGYDRRGRVHHDAQRTMICVAGFLVGMRDLRNSQQGKQNQTHKRYSRKSTSPCAAVPLVACLKSSKQ